MDRKFSVVCDEDVAAEIETLAREHGISHEEVIRQLIDVGLESIATGATASRSEP